MNNHSQGLQDVLDGALEVSDARPQEAMARLRSLLAGTLSVLRALSMHVENECSKGDIWLR